MGLFWHQFAQHQFAHLHFLSIIFFIHAGNSTCNARATSTSIADLRTTTSMQFLRQPPLQQQLHHLHSRLHLRDSYQQRHSGHDNRSFTTIFEQEPRRNPSAPANRATTSSHHHLRTVADREGRKTQHREGDEQPLNFHRSKNVKQQQ